MSYQSSRISEDFRFIPKLFLLISIKFQYFDYDYIFYEEFLCGFMKKRNILVAVIDDSYSVRDALKMVLENQQWEAMIYSSGDAFLADFKGHRPDCIVLDSHLPGMTGTEIAQFITSGDDPIPTVVLTAYPNSLQTNEIKNMGIDRVLLKPVSENVLIEHIQAAIISG